MKRIIITPYEEFIVTALYDGNHMVEVQAESAENASLLGNIYIGRVAKIVKNINAAFIDIGIGQDCYYSLEDNSNPIYVRKGNSSKLCQDDWIIVQVSQEARKTKPPTVTSKLNFQGRYVAVKPYGNEFGLSKKLALETREELEDILRPMKPEGVSVIVRTNAATGQLRDIEREFKELTRKATEDIEAWKHRSLYSLLDRSQPEYMEYIKNLNEADYDEILTDSIDILRDTENYLLENAPLLKDRLKFYGDEYGLKPLYSLEKNIQEALSKKVWLKSGAYLVIDYTEAMTVIDVNSGKNTGHKDKIENLYKINREAAYEIARQIRLRNISGIIMVDFIDMYNPDLEEDLCQYMTALTQKDSCPVQILGMTRLRIMEMTRKKKRRPFYEQVRCQIKDKN